MQLGEIGVVHCGQSPPTAAVNKEGRGTPYVTGPEQWDGSRLHMDKWTTQPKRMAPAGSVFVTVKGAGVGTVFPGVAAAIGRDVYAFEPKAGISPSFVEHALRFTVQDVIRHAVGDIPGLSKSHLTDHWIGLPPAEEQQSIVAAIESHFSRLDAATATLERVQRNLERYRASVLKAAVEGRLVPTEAELARKESRSYEPASALMKRILAERRRRWEEAELAKMKAKGKAPTDDRWKARYEEPAAPDTEGLPELPEGWRWTSIGNAFEVSVGATPSRQRPEYWGGAVPWVSSGEVSFCRIKATRETITEAGLMNSSTKLNPAGTVLIGMIGEGRTRGQVAILDVAACNNQNAAAIRVSEAGLSPEFVYHYLASKYNDNRGLGSGNNQPALNKSRVEGIPLPLPPLCEQVRVAAAVDDLLSVVQHAGHEIETARTRILRLRQSILKWAFEGRLVQSKSEENAGVVALR